MSTEAFLRSELVCCWFLSIGLVVFVVVVVVVVVGTVDVVVGCFQIGCLILLDNRLRG